MGTGRRCWLVCGISSGSPALWGRRKGLGEEAGFETCDIDHYGGHLDYVPGPCADGGESGEGRMETLGILGHVDVVPEGSGWDHPPYGGEIADG